MATNKFSSSNKRTFNSNPTGVVNSLHGMYIGIVKANGDAQHNGRLRVFIPEFGGIASDESTWISVNYCSPFAGVTPTNLLGKEATSSYNSAQTSYGMWMIPPDLENRVAVMFHNGDSGHGYWLGCVFEEFHNQMVPAIASSEDNAKYKGKSVPVAEYNKHTTETPDWDKVTRPVHEQAFNSIADQGLINDHIRGTTTSSARRESPSQVYGISTPGPKNPESKGNRLGGSKIIMDDGEGTEYIGFRTRSGAYLRIDETNGIIYAINKKGTAWLQLDEEGNIDAFSAKSISIRAMEDVNIRADRDIVMEAGNDIKIKASKDYSGTEVVATPFGGGGGNIIVEANNKLDVTITSEAKFNFKDSLDIKVATDGRVDVVKNLDITTDNTTHTSKTDTKLLAKGNFMLTTNKNLDVLSTMETKITAQMNMNLNSNLSMKQMAALDYNITGGVAVNTQSLAISMLGGTSIRSTAPVISDNGAPASPAMPPTPASAAPPAKPPLTAAIIPMNSKTNILSSFSNKFTRNNQKLKSIVGRFMTYEPCPEHINKGTSSSFSKYQWYGETQSGTQSSLPKPVPYEEGTTPPPTTEDEVAIPVVVEDLKCGTWSTPDSLAVGSKNKGTYKVINPKEMYEAQFQEAGAHYGVPPEILSRVAMQESSFNPSAYNKSGASGLMQIVPRWHPTVKNPNDPNEAIPYSAKYLSELKKKFGTWDKALAAYNWGPGNVSKSIGKHGDNWRNHLPAETANYVSEIGHDVGLFGCPLEESALTPPPVPPPK